ncbi:SDR family oxidoreductase [Nocardioides sp. Kera G14]|uniref:SDR family oxidoreductase n=1 Tax=Nocardioides sp. Kera G14 TaxID=2884264 RepID=UPI001D106B9D|nr:SDR family oxidoreductase [Nocardioides sp. Kera G14]UDY22218.1 SDR family oxidoreductase [Nocardioides sp. Kera G14]
MSLYVVTGSASGMGSAVVERLKGSGHDVLTVDQHDADVVADLSTAEGRARAGREVLKLSEGRLDGAVLAAGLGPALVPGRAKLVLEVNYNGVVELLEAWRPALAAGGNAKVVAFGSNSSTTVPLVPAPAISALLRGRSDRALWVLNLAGRQAPTFAYAASKIALARWIRRNATAPEWIGAGIRLNALAPGAIMTPLLERQLATPAEAKLIRQFPIPAGGFGDPGQLADWVVFMLGPAADFLVGSVVFVDGGSDAWFRADDWPRGVPARRLRGYLKRMKEFRR